MSFLSNFRPADYWHRMFSSPFTYFSDARSELDQAKGPTSLAQHKNQQIRFFAIAISILLGISSIGHAQESPQITILPLTEMQNSFSGDLTQMLERRVIRALVARSKTDFFIHNGKPSGAMADFLIEYEKVLNAERSKSDIEIKIVYVPVRFDQLIPSLLAGKGDLIAAMMSITPEREEQVDFVSGRRFSVNEVVVTSSAVGDLESLQDLAGRSVYVLPGSSYLAHLKVFSESLVEQGRKPIEIVDGDPNLTLEDILELTNAGVVSITVADDFKANLWAKALPDITVRNDLKLNSDGNIGWAVRKSNPELKADLLKFSESVRKGSLLGNMLFKKYYQSEKFIKNPGAEEEREKLHQVTVFFKKYADQYEFDYLALVAQAFQESGLDQSVRSPAGAVGIMQLLPSTAADSKVGIPNIESVESNIHAGAKYMALLRDTYFNEPELTEKDRLAFLWAAYNAGPNKVRKLRKQASEMGLDPNRWFFNVEHVAREVIGQETVRYVSNIYKYYIAYHLLTQLSGEEL